MSIQGFEQSAVNSPQFHGLVKTSRGNHLTVWAEIDTHYLTAMSNPGFEQSAVNSPQFHGLVTTSRGDHLTVWTEIDAHDQSFMPL